MDRSIISIRESVAIAVGKLRSDPPADRGEAILCRDGYVVGHQFKFDGVRAVWLASQGQIKFYADDGAVLRVVDVSEPRQTKAA